MRSSQELKLKGIPVSPGIVIAPVKIFKRKRAQVKERILKPTEIEDEVSKFTKGTEKLISVLNELKMETKEENLARLLDVEISILNDTEMQNDVILLIRNKRRNAESAISSVFNNRKESLLKHESSYMRERANELERLGMDLIAMINDDYSREDFGFDGIIATESLSIEQALRIVRSNAKGVVTEVGGRTEHSALILRNFEVPTVFGIEKITKLVEDGDTMILDGGKGVVIINPMDSTLNRYFFIKSGYERYESGLASERDLPAITVDGKEIGLYANIDIPEEADRLLDLGKYGIGLFRTEMVFNEYSSDEEKQHQIYYDIAKKVYPNSVTIRSFDVGGDKFYSDYTEENPFLGLRGIRVLLEEQEVFERQIRAVIRANVHSNIRFMIPMVSNYEEVLEAKKIFLRNKKLLEKQQNNVNQPRFGVMIEVPSAVFILEHIAELVDFVSIGTNDLTQYTLAVNRKSLRVSKLFNHLHPAVLKLIQITTDICREKNIVVASCGEMASDPYGVVLLVGFGIDEISCPSSRILEVKSLIRRINLSDAEQIAAEAVKKSNHRAVKDLVGEYLKSVMPELLEFYE
ncbi:MAG TPA: phosphoenolpyruvate--protein phosphotransferase [Candidatus Hydrothermia bacterium]|nr:phosphoenolpyruvate--protein phosphotransferase [Candidatus Hydrothermia bacterium]